MKQFGGKVTKELITRYEESSNWKDGKFQNLVNTTMEISFQALPKLLYKQFCENKEREPSGKLPIQAFINDQFLNSSDQAQFIWYGHSVLLMNLSGKVILIEFFRCRLSFIHKKPVRL